MYLMGGDLPLNKYNFEALTASIEESMLNAQNAEPTHWTPVVCVNSYD